VEEDLRKRSTRRRKKKRSRGLREVQTALLGNKEGRSLFPQQVLPDAQRSWTAPPASGSPDGKVNRSGCADDFVVKSTHL
jgi:hypothetical protein